MDNSDMIPQMSEHVFPSIQITAGTYLVVQWLRICLAMQGIGVGSLVGKLRPHMPQSN